MGNAITINNQNVLVKQYKGQRVLTFKDIDTVHGRPDGTARKCFNDNKTRFIEGEDYFNIQMSEKRTLEFDVPNRGITVITESGYLMLTKSFTDDLSWTVQRQLVNSYFNFKETKVKEKQLSLYNYFDKKYKGEAVLSVADVEYFTKLDRYRIRKTIKCGVEFMDYYQLKGKALSEFKRENNMMSSTINELFVITESGFKLICEAYGIKVETPKLFIEEKAQETKERAKAVEYAVVLDNPKVQAHIEQLTGCVDAMKVLLQLYNRHNVKIQDLRSRADSICDIAAVIGGTAAALSLEKIQTTSKYKW